MKKLALLLTLCLVVTMLPGIGYTENEPMGDEIEVQIEGVTTDADLSPDFSGDIADAAQIGDELDLDLAISDENLEQAGEEEQGVPESGETESSFNESTPHIDPDGPRLAANTLTLGIEDYFYLDDTMPDAGESAYTYVSSDSTIAKVYKSSRVTGVSVGFACITAVDAQGRYSECYVYVKKAPEIVSFGTDKLTLGKGETYDRLHITMGIPEEDYAGSYSFTSENSKVVKVKDNHTVKASRVGETRLKIETYNGLIATLPVKVKKEPSKITLSVDKPVMGVGEAGQVRYTLPKNTAGAVTFTSTNPDVVSVDSETGIIEALSAGEAQIYGVTYNGKESHVTVTVVDAPAWLNFDTDVVKLGVGMEVTPAAFMSEGTVGSIEYTVENPEVASWDGKYLKGLKKGKTVLTATAYNGVSAQCPVEVFSAPKKVSLPYSELNLGVKQSVKLEPDVGASASTFAYSSSNSKVAKVSTDGTVTGVKRGSATITVRTYNGKKCRLKVNVLKAPGSVELMPEQLEVGVGESAALTWSFPKGTAAAVNFVSSDPDIAEVDFETGLVTGVSAGEAVITVTTSNGKRDFTTVTVALPAEWVQITEDNVEIGVKQPHQLNVELNPGASTTLTFKSADRRIAKVSEDGVVTGVRAGQTTITVYTSVEGVEDQVTVTVLPAPKSVRFDPDAVSLNIGETVLLMPAIPEGTATGFTYGTSAPEIATVSEDGTLTAIARGEATVTATTSNGIEATLYVTVVDPQYPESASLLNAPSSMKAGDTLQLEWEVDPIDALVDFAWESSNADIAYVDAAGVLYAVNMGYATITARSQRNPDIVLSFRVSVETDDVVLTIPRRITAVSGIAKNLEQIDAIRVCAIGQIDALQANGQITSADASRRKRIINNAFGDYAFPWMTLEKQLYWKKENSEGGAKDFKTGQVYYGVPYISGSGDNRSFNVEKLLNKGIYYDSGKGYYILNQSKINGRNYYGNDCSCFVDAAIWGTNSSHSNDRTKEIAKSSAYKTIKSYDNMRTGDLICKGGNHVVMFLYYVNADKSKIMIIENGGIEPGTNTVHCMVMNVSWYTSRDYKVRRLASLG